MSRENPEWLQEARELCRAHGIKIVGWGPDVLTVEGKSEERIKEVTAHLGQLGFKAIQNDADSGLLDLSKNPPAVQAKIASFDISRRRWDERIVPLIWALCSLLLIPAFTGRTGRTPYWAWVIVGVLSLVQFFRDAPRIWGWKLELHEEGLHIQRNYRWSTIPWEQIRSVESVSRGGRNQETVTLHLKGNKLESLGSFNFPFARCLRDRLRIEIAQRHKAMAEYSSRVEPVI